MSVPSRDTRGVFPRLTGCQHVLGPWSRPVWVAVVLLVTLPGVAQASTVATEVSVSNMEPVIEDHEASLSGPQESTVIVWVWVSDANGVEDLASIELSGDDELIAVEGGEPAQVSGTVARFELTFPEDAMASPVTVSVADSAGSEDSMALGPLPGTTGNPGIEEHGVEKTVPFATVHLLVALSTASILVRRSSR